MDTLEKTELIASIYHNAKFLKAGIPIYNSKVPYTAGRKTRKRRIRTQTIAKRHAFYANAENEFFWFVLSSYQTKYADVQLFAS